MKVKAVRLHAANDLRLDEFELPEIKDDEILVKVISDSVCMSTYKCAILGTKHKRVHADVADHPAIMGHEMAGDIVKVGKAHQDKFKPGMKFTLQPALNYKGTMWSPGYSYEFFGGNATYCIIPAEVMELGCMLEYKGRAYYEASLAEPYSCSVGAFHAAYHTKMGVYTHEMGIVEGGKLAILAGAGPMGLGALSYAMNCDRRPGMIVVTDVNKDRLARAEELFPIEEAKEKYPKAFEPAGYNRGKRPLKETDARKVLIAADIVLAGTGIFIILFYLSFTAPNPSRRRVLLSLFFVFVAGALLLFFFIYMHFSDITYIEKEGGPEIMYASLGDSLTG